MCGDPKVQKNGKKIGNRNNNWTVKHDKNWKLPAMYSENKKRKLKAWVNNSHL